MVFNINKQEMIMGNAANWFEIPANDIDRAKDFYSNILGSELQEITMGEYRMLPLPHGEGKIGGAIVSGEGCKPSEAGTMIYLNGGEDLNTVLSKVETAGGKVVMPKSLVDDEIGYMAIFIDTEGNRLGLHSMG